MGIGDSLPKDDNLEYLVDQLVSAPPAPPGLSLGAPSSHIQPSSERARSNFGKGPWPVFVPGGNQTQTLPSSREEMDKTTTQNGTFDELVDFSQATLSGQTHAQGILAQARQDLLARSRQNLQDPEPVTDQRPPPIGFRYENPSTTIDKTGWPADGSAIVASAAPLTDSEQQALKAQAKIARQQRRSESQYAATGRKAHASMATHGASSRRNNYGRGGQGSLRNQHHFSARAGSFMPAPGNQSMSINPEQQQKGRPR